MIAEEPMPIRCDDYDKACVITVEGDLATDNAAAVRKIAVDHIEGKQIVDFVLDLEKCTFADSEGLETLLWLKRRCDELFGQMKLVAVDENFRKILEITRLDAQFDCQTDLAMALKMMR